MRFKKARKLKKNKRSTAVPAVFLTRVFYPTATLSFCWLLFCRDIDHESRQNDGGQNGIILFGVSCLGSFSVGTTELRWSFSCP